MCKILSLILLLGLVSCGGSSSSPKTAAVNSTPKLLEGATPETKTPSASPSQNTPAIVAKPPVTATSVNTPAPTPTPVPTPSNPPSTQSTLIPISAMLTAGKPANTKGKWAGDCTISPKNDLKVILSFCYLELTITHQEYVNCHYLNVDYVLRTGAFNPVDRNIVTAFSASMSVNLPKSMALDHNAIMDYRDCMRKIDNPRTIFNTYGWAGLDGLIFDKWNGAGPIFKLYLKNSVLYAEYSLNGNLLQATLK